MFRGHIDAVTSSGYVEGWAYDAKHPVGARLIAIYDGNGVERASGYAHRYRADLAAGGMGTGWCGFRLAMTGTRKLRRSRFILVDRLTSAQLHPPHPIAFVEDGSSAITSIEALISSDPTMIDSIDQLSGCEEIFNAVISRRGVEAFVKLAYVYVLGRAADREGIATYGRLLRRAAMSPFTLLKILADSEEFRSRPRFLTSPNTSGFPFQ